jgi:hypothetical protein
VQASVDTHGWPLKSLELTILLSMTQITDPGMRREMIDLILDFGRNDTATLETLYSMLDSIDKPGLITYNKGCLSVLQLAMRLGHDKLVGILLKHAKLDHVNAELYLMEAVYIGREDILRHVAKAIVKCGINILCLQLGKNIGTSFLYAVVERPKLAYIMLDIAQRKQRETVHSAVNESLHGKGPLQMAIINNDLPMVRLLVAAGADTSRLDSSVGLNIGRATHIMYLVHSESNRSEEV